MRFALAAFETGSFRQAAARLRVRESTVSRRIRDLELVIGTPIFIRLPTGVKATKAGLHFMKLAKEALASFDAALRLQNDDSRNNFRFETAGQIVFEGSWIATRLLD